MIYSSYLFPGGKSKAVTLSYDDGVVDDRRLVELFNRHGLKATFHLNSGIDRPGDVLRDAASLYQEHEIAGHSKTHPTLTRVPPICVVNQLLEDRLALERLAGYPVRGFSYPNGAWSADLLPLLQAAGIAYARTTVSTGHFALPEQWLAWHPTCHHNDKLLERTENFLNSGSSFILLYVWGHSYEFSRQNTWPLIEAFCTLAGGRDDLWYATNIDIHDYAQALQRLQFSADGALVRNPSARPVWLNRDGHPVELPAGTLTSLA